MARSSRSAAVIALARALRGARRPGEAGIGESLRAVPRWVAATVTGRYPGTSKGQLVALAGAVLYTVSPLDLVPEFIPVFGVLDDAVVVTWLAGRLLTESAGFLTWERTVGQEQDVVPGHVVQG